MCRLRFSVLCISPLSKPETLKSKGGTFKTKLTILYDICNPKKRCVKKRRIYIILKIEIGLPNTLVEQPLKC